MGKEVGLEEAMGQGVWAGGGYGQGGKGWRRLWGRGQGLEEVIGKGVRVGGGHG